MSKVWVQRLPVGAYGVLTDQGLLVAKKRFALSPPSGILIFMFGGILRRIANKRLEKRFRDHFNNATGPDSHRNAVAIAMMELEDPWVATVMACFTAEEQPIFLMAYECFLLWVILRALQLQLKVTEVQYLTNRVRDAFVQFGRHDPVIFMKIWPFTRELMPIALQGGAQTGAVYPLPIIMQAAASAGYPLPQKVLSYKLGVHVLIAMKRMTDAVNTGNESITNLSPKM